MRKKHCCCSCETSVVWLESRFLMPFEVIANMFKKYRRTLPIALCTLLVGIPYGTICSNFKLFSHTRSWLFDIFFQCLIQLEPPFLAIKKTCNMNLRNPTKHRMRRQVKKSDQDSATLCKLRFHYSLSYWKPNQNSFSNK